ncbi:MAG: 16S rRNA (cytidine(1402)-2'-O)-methyltransferase [Acidimicrobiaceae bacterium]|nr:16S rRNA (cytidine(1402)-2'-O)-methyltransferase [Acidimicrobiaceae bacterium]MCY4176566.1 16S rRNA (cytidine(1402)-2'-O)-methyltransferase [Acidimicrobiaceae bacterium]MCY4279306.1 16S rRNA (cytidine(1402)-2'-O)-methyltransferase [Acidimicrobiaceae bacterium]MCY4294696.1 16S rRNA (cytidine(1402)-2'-O)-methyltransferase [Acidimicrobiaceae bacterium]
MTASLVLVATPIGNLGDLSPRAVEALAGADLICCEDTRRTGRLLAHAGVGRGAAGRPRLRRLDEHTEAAAIPEILELLEAGAAVALVSDAGMPALNDPGARLVAATAEAGHAVTVVPGPSAGSAALAVSGLAADRHCFEGFLPRRGEARAGRLAEIAAHECTTVIYESPHRLAACLQDLADACGAQRRAVVARELTKLHEEIVRGRLGELRDWAAAGVKGEAVIVLEGAPARHGAVADADTGADVERLRGDVERLVSTGVTRRDAVAAVAVENRVPRRWLYNTVLRSNDRR